MFPSVCSSSDLNTAAVLHHPTFLQSYLKASGRSSSSSAQQQQRSPADDNIEEACDEDDEDEASAGCSPQFGSLVMAVCAVASRSLASDEPRVLAKPSNPRSAGLKYFKMARMLLMTASARLDLHYVQVRPGSCVLFLMRLRQLTPSGTLFFLRSRCSTWPCTFPLRARLACLNLHLLTCAPVSLIHCSFTEGFGTSATHSGYVGEMASLALTSVPPDSCRRCCVRCVYQTLHMYRSGMQRDSTEWGLDPVASEQRKRLCELFPGSLSIFAKHVPADPFSLIFLLGRQSGASSTTTSQPPWPSVDPRWCA